LDVTVELEAEREIGKGRYRGPLHGIPYGLKDLCDIKDIRTTWGRRAASLGFPRLAGQAARGGGRGGVRGAAR